MHVNPCTTCSTRSTNGKIYALSRQTRYTCQRFYQTGIWFRLPSVSIKTVPVTVVNGNLISPRVYFRVSTVVLLFLPAHCRKKKVSRFDGGLIIPTCALWKKKGKQVNHCDSKNQSRPIAVRSGCRQKKR